MSAARVLVAEDEAIVAEDIADTLRALGYEVVGPCATGSEAIARGIEKEVDVALMDIHLAGTMDGVEAARRLMEHAVGIIFVTAYADDETLARAKLAKPYGYLVKPVTERDLKTALGVALYKRQAEAEIARQRHLLQTVLGSVTEVIIGLDADARISFLNTAAETLTGLKDADARGRRLSEVLRLRSPGSASLDEGIVRAVQRGQPGRIAGRSQAKPMQGAGVHVEGLLTPMLGGQGVPIGAVLMLRDTASESRIAALEAEILALREQFIERVRQLV